MDYGNILEGEVPSVPYQVLFTSITRKTSRQLHSTPKELQDHLEWMLMSGAGCAHQPWMLYVMPSLVVQDELSLITASLQAYVACRLIPLNKQPGVRPFGIGEVIRRIIGKAILSITSKAIEQAAGSLHSIVCRSRMRN